MKVECGIKTCIYNKFDHGDYGICQKADGIVLKWRLAADLGKGSIVMMECLNLTFPEEEK